MRWHPLHWSSMALLAACLPAAPEEPSVDTFDSTTTGPEETDDGDEPAPPSDTPTFYDDVAPVLAHRCRGCHASDGIASLPLQSYDEVAALAPLVASAVESGTMPPWHVGDDGACNEFRDSRRLPPAEIDTLVAWYEGGAPAGEERPLPVPEPLPALERVDLTLTPEREYLPSATVADDYRCFVINPGLEEDRFLTGFSVRPGQPSVVHHVVLFSVDTPAEEALAQQLDQASEEPGYSCYGGAETGGGRSLLVWTPGTGATHYPENTGLRLVAGQSVIMQVHYFGGGVRDRTAIDVTLAESVAEEAFITATFDLDLEIPAGLPDHVETAAIPLPPWDVPMKIHAVYPHMHRFGTALRVDYDRDGRSRCLVDVPDYAFAWQQFFFYRQPIVLDPPGGGYFRIRCRFDSTSANETVRSGEGTSDEMCMAALYVTYAMP